MRRCERIPLISLGVRVNPGSYERFAGWSGEMTGGGDSLMDMTAWWILWTGLGLRGASGMPESRGPRIHV